jgi:hypothetical protein
MKAVQGEDKYISDIWTEKLYKAEGQIMTSLQQIRHFYNAMDSILFTCNCTFLS